MKKLFWVLLLWPFALPAAETLFVVNPEWPDFIEADGSGIYMDILNAVYTPHGFELKYEVTPFKRASMYIQKGLKDIQVGIYSNKRLAELGFEIKGLTPRWPITLEKVVAMSKAAYVQFPWQGLDSLNNREVAAIRGYGYDEMLSVSMQYSEVDNEAQAFEMLLAGRFEFFINDYLDITAYFKRHGEEKSRFEMHDLYSANLYPVFPISDKGRKLADLFDQEMPKLINSGFVAKLYQQAGYDAPVLKPED